jgi:pyrroline-5-carboxylate reductase
MGTALLSGFIEANLVDQEQLAVVEPDHIQKLKLSESFPSVKVLDVVDDCETLILSVKPNVATDVIDQINSFNCSIDRIISIMAGITCEYLASRLKNKTAIIRSMPNTPSMVNKGMIAVTKGPGATSKDLTYAIKLLSAVGKVVEVDQSQMDVITAISGSGPAYVFYLTEALTKAGIRLGLDDELSSTLAKQTVIGSGILMEKTGEEPIDLRLAVTSKGGTTQAAIEQLDRDNVNDLFFNAVQAAANRSKELGEILK